MNILEQPIDQIALSFGAPSYLKNGDSHQSAVERINESNMRINTCLTAFVEIILQKDYDGEFLMLTPTGYLRKGVICILSDRYKSLTRIEKKRLSDRMLKLTQKHGIPRLVRYNPQVKIWFVDIRSYAEIETARLYVERVQFPMLQQEF